MLKIDLHTHTIASIHAFSTIKEMADEAAKRGMKVLGITDHGPSVEDSPTLNYFNVGMKLPKKINGMRILFGVEANILDRSGKLDMEDEMLEKMDVVITGIHNEAEGCVDLGIKKNTEAIINAMKNPHIDIISHPYDFDSGYKTDVEKIAQAACDMNKIVEVSSKYFYFESPRYKKGREGIKKVVDVFKKNNQKLLITSDAHSAFEVGRDIPEKDKKILGLTEDNILNNDVDAVLKYLGVEN